MSLDLAPAIRTALIEDAEVQNFAGEWRGAPAVATRRPVPAEFPARMLLINPDAAIGNEDAINSDRPIVVRDIAIYGNQPDDYREVEALGYHLRTKFHRQKWSIEPEGYSVVDIVVSGPIPGPVDDDKTVARIVSLTIRLRRSQ